MALREPRKKELKRIVGALRYFNSLDFLKDHVVLIRENEKKEVVALSKDLASFLEKSGLMKFCIAGLKIGEVGRRFRFSLEGAFWLVKADKKKVWVNEKGEMLFLYGRDIFASSVIKATDFGENEIVFVCNKYGDILGIGKSRFPAEKIAEVEENRVVVENLVDRGEYIRHSRLYNSF